MAANVNETDDQREQQLAEVARLYLTGQTQAAIGKQLGIAQSQVCYDLKIIRQRWLDSQVRDFDEARAVELAKIDAVEVQFWVGWERSLRDKEIKQKKSKTGVAASEEEGTTVHGQAGDPRFLDGVMKCIQKRCELLGLDAAKKLSLLDGDGNNYGPFLTEDERRARLLAVLLEQGTEGGPGPTVM